MNQNISKQIDILKVITIILVVFAHVTRMYTGDGVIKMEVNPVLALITKYIYSFHMPLFVMLSGTVYYICKCENDKYKIESKFILNKAKRLLIPYLFFAFFIVLPTLIFIDAIHKPYISYVVNGLLLAEDPKHLWYLVMLFGVFVLFNHFENRIKEHKLIAAAIMLIFYGCSFMAPSILQINTILRYSIYFYIGYNYPYVVATVNKINRTEIWVVMHMFLFILMSINNYNFLNPIFLLVTSILGICIMVSLAMAICNVNDNYTQSKFYNVMKRDSFGVYLFHPMIIYMLFFCKR